MMRLPKFEYHTPQTIAEAVKIMGDVPAQGQFVAGGTDLYPNMKRRQQMPKTVISVMRLAELNQITGDGNSGLRIGASVTLTDICEHPIINRDYPVVAKPLAPSPRHSAKHGNHRRQPATRHPLQLLRSKLRVAQRH